jgi:hypothetical protein
MRHKWLALGSATGAIRKENWPPDRYRFFDCEYQCCADCAATRLVPYQAGLIPSLVECQLSGQLPLAGTSDRCTRQASTPNEIPPPHRRSTDGLRCYAEDKLSTFFARAFCFFVSLFRYI